MGIDMKKMRERLITLKNKGGSSNSFWRPQDGEQTIRIVPTNDGDPFKDYWFHYNVGDNPGFLSPKRNFGEDCPLDSFVRQLWQEGTEDSKKMAKKLQARQRFFDITDTEAGTDLTIIYGKPTGASFPVTNITPRRQSSPLCQDGPEKCRELLETIPDFEDLFAGSRKTFAEVQSMLDEFLLGDSNPEEISSETTKYNDGKTEGSGNSVDKAFADLLG